MCVSRTTVICSLAFIISIAPCLSLSSNTKEVVITARIGDPFALEFNTGSDINLEDSYITKNGEKLQTESNLQKGKLVFQQLAATDSGKYYFVGISKKASIVTQGPIVLKGMLIT